MHCNTCTSIIKILINSEMICFPCYNDRKIQLKPVTHSFTMPKPINSGIEVN